MKKILIIDDDRDLSYLLKRALSYSNCDALISNNSLEGIALAKNQKPDLILMDIRLPDLNGVELAKILKSDPATQKIPVMFITALMKEDKQYTITVDDSNYAIVTKPFEIKSLVNKIQALIN